VEVHGSSRPRQRASRLLLQQLGNCSWLITICSTQLSSEHLQHGTWHEEVVTAHEEHGPPVHVGLDDNWAIVLQYRSSTRLARTSRPPLPGARLGSPPTFTNRQNGAALDLGNSFGRVQAGPLYLAACDHRHWRRLNPVLGQARGDRQRRRRARHPADKSFVGKLALSASWPGHTCPTTGPSGTSPSRNTVMASLNSRALPQL
jgi:hypothetical protein